MVLLLTNNTAGDSNHRDACTAILRHVDPSTASASVDFKAVTLDSYEAFVANEVAYNAYAEGAKTYIASVELKKAIENAEAIGIDVTDALAVYTNMNSTVENMECAIASLKTVEIDGIHYNLIFENKTAEVKSNPNKYTGNVVIPESVSFNGKNYSVKSIDYNAFSGCSGLTSITIPKSVITIGKGAFSGCSGLITITINCEIVEYWFNYTKSLKSIILGDDLKIIGKGAFSGCSGLTSVTIGNGVKQIYGSAFANCPELTDMYCYAESVPTTNSDAFDGSYIEHATLHVPASAVNAYKNTAPWSKFKKIVGIGKQYYTLTYIVDSTKYKEYSVGEGDNITAEPAPTKDGYTFSGWSSIPATMPANDVTVTGTFTKNAATTYTLTYMVDGVVYKTFSYEAGATVARVEAPTKEGYTFSGWSNTLLTMPERNVTITGTFTKNVTPTPTPTPTYTLTYMVNGEVYKTVSYEYGEKITPEPEPTKEGATFSGWSWIPSKMPDEDVVVTGTFDMEKYKLTYKVDGADYKILEVEVGAAITPEPEPTKDGYTFSGWSWIPKKMPDEDVTITGTFTPSTGVETAVGSGRPFDVYTVTGRKVRSQVTSLKGLKKGVYIVEGKKVVVK